jgi:TP901 family phage tail tape measure protein
MSLATIKVPTIFTAVDKFTGVVGKMQSGLLAFGNKAKSISDISGNISKKAGIGALAIAAPLAIVANSAIKFQDRLADISKTTGLTGADLDKFGASILDTSKTTRTGIDELLTIGEIGGQLGVASKELEKFTKASNVFNVALGADYGGVDEAISQVGGIKNLFKETRDLDISDVITKSGSAINTLGSIGAGTSKNINDFILRIGALPDAIKPGLQSTAALGTLFEENRIDAQVAAGGLSNFFLVAGKNLDKFARQMGLSKGAAKDLFATDPTKFAADFATSLKGMAPDKLAKKLNSLGIGSQETLKVIGALGNGTKRLTELQEAANKAFSDGTSLQTEYNTKNSTVAAEIKQAQNNFEAFSITLGTQVLPIISRLIDQILPAVSAIVTWVEQNPELTTTILEVAGGIAAFLGVVSVISGIVSAATGVMWLLNAAMAANPVGIIIIAVVALIALITTIIAKWDSWGAALTLFLGPLGLVISFIKTLYDNWSMVTEAFKDGGIWGAIKAIGKILFASLIYPVEQLLSLIGKVTGANWANDAAKSLKDVRAYLGVATEGQPVIAPKVIPPPLLTAQVQAQREQAKDRASLIELSIKDPGKYIESLSHKGPIKPNIIIGNTSGQR